MNYYELEPENNTFHTLLADVTHRCNMKCANCYIPNRQIPDMDAEKFLEFASRLPKRTDIRLIGAEATLRKDLPELISGVRRLGHRPSILTNGLKLADFDYCRTLKQSGLRSLGLSMNGADQDEVYRILDGGNFAKKKLQALENCLRVGFVVHINCILAKGVSEEIPWRLYQLLMDACKKTNKKIGRLYPLMLRFKNIGAIGRHMDGDNFSEHELLDLCAQAFHLDSNQIAQYKNIDGFTECNAYLFPVETPLGELYVKVTNWQVDKWGVPDPGSRRRGRVTPDFKIAPFFEHVKLNENEY